MPAKFPDSNFENAIQAYVAGEGAESIALRLHIGEKRLRDELKLRGLFRDRATRLRLVGEKSSATNRAKNPLPMEQIISDYLNGVSENALAKQYGTMRSAIRTRLIVAGVPIRDNTEANRLLAASRTPEQRKQYALAANAASRGRHDTLETKIRRAKTREAKQTHTSPAELLLREWLSQRGVDCIPQQAIGPYNADLGAFPVAVEVFGGNWHASGDHARRGHERFRYILDQGWSVVIIWVDGRNYPLSTEAADYVAAFIQQTRSDPSFRRQYRVIWGDGKAVPLSRLNLDNLTLEPSRCGRDDPRGCNHRSCWDAVDM